jgi:hypothetical protein
MEIVLLILLIILILLIYTEISLNYNKKKHLTDSYSFAHFSNINSGNYFFNYDFLFRTSPNYIELNEGETLYIPPKMWHWITTENTGFSVSFWFEKDPNKEIKHNNYKLEPIINKIDGNKILQEFNNCIKDKKQQIWNSSNNSGITLSGNDFLNSKEKNRAFVTLDGYGFDNFEIKNHLHKKIGIPNSIKNVIKQNSYYDMNLWYIPRSHDTGLHYDDYDGFLHLIKGKKKIYLYPPSDSKYLSPYNVIPDYALTKPNFMNYNQNYIYKSNVKGKPSSFLLYNTLKYFAINKNIHKIIQKIYDNKSPNTYLIWGFKKKGHEYRWEIYIYHYKPSNINHTCKDNILIQNYIHDNPTSELNPNVINEITNNPNIIINSFDILNNNTIFNNEIHTYEKVLYNDELPLWGCGYDINSKKIHVGNFVYDDKENFLKNSDYYLKKLDLPSNLNVIKILSKYECKNLCVWNKNNDLFIQWLVISIEDFIGFLQENNYKQDFIDYIISNQYDFKYISHEITVVYNKYTLEPIRCGFYGCL